MNAPSKNRVKLDLTPISPVGLYVMSHQNSSCIRYTNIDFEKKLVRASFKKEFGLHLPGLAKVQMCSYFFDPCVSNFKPSTRSPKVFAQGSDGTNQHSSGKLHKTRGAVSDWHKQTLNSNRAKHRVLKSKHGFELSLAGIYKPPQKQFLTLNYLSASWVLEHIKTQFHHKRSARAIFNTTLNEVSLVMARLKSSCPIKGIRLSASGRLGKRKKAMAQQLSRSLGAVTLSGFKHKVDLSQDFVATPLGTVGLKVWICYA